MSSEQLIEVGGGITLCAEQFGSADDPPILLVMGLGQQLLAWSDDFCELLAAQGFSVIRFDNRDIGRSTHLRDVPPPTRSQLVTRNFGPRQYSLEDMARDAAGLLDALGATPAHVVGISLGGMIAQTLAAEHPDHVRSLTSIMSSTGSRRAGWVAFSTLRLMLSAPPRDREAAAARASMMFRHIGSHGFAFDENMIRERAMRQFDRDPHAAAGTGRQMAAILKSGDRTPALRSVTAPTLVIHGDRDRMVHPSGGRATAAAIAGARLETIAGMGHDLPAGLYERITELIAEHAHAADRQPRAAAAR